MSDMLQPLAHYALHFLAPGLIAFFFFRDQWLRAWAIMIATMVVDADHLLATPVFDAGRCSIGFHPLHSMAAMAAYAAMTLAPKLRLIGIGLLFHMATDAFDCSWIV